MRFAGIGDNIQIPFALEFGVLIREEVERSEPVLFNVELDLEQRQVIVQRSQVTTYTYTLTSRVERDITVLIERRDPTRDEYYEMPAPAFSGSGHTRWSVPVSGNSSTSFPIHIRSLQDSREDISKWKADFIEQLRHQGFLADQLHNQLQALLEAKQQVMDAANEMKMLQAEHQRIQALQEQLRKNLGALGDSQRETAIRDQLLTDLENSENRRRTLEARAVTLEQQANQANIRQETILNDIYASE